jgi:hypothetical protein
MGLLDLFRTPPEYRAHLQTPPRPPLAASPDPRAQALREGYLDVVSESGDPDLLLSATQGGSLYFRRLSAGVRELPPLKFERLQALAHLLAQRNPLARRALELLRDFALGEGVRYVVHGVDDEQRRDQLQQVLDRFYDENNLELDLDDYVFELGQFGEQCWMVRPNPVDGSVSLGYVDPTLIHAVHYDPRNRRQPERVELSERDEQGRVITLPVVRRELDPRSRRYGRLVLPEGAEEGCFYWAINKPALARRGLSDLCSVIDYCDAYEQFVFGEIDRALMLRTFIWDVLLRGFSEQQIEDWLKRHGSSPRPGGVRAHNESVEWTAVSPQLQASDSQAIGDLVLSLIATGMGIPKTWLSGTMDVNRATAQELGEPAFKRLTKRQRLVRAMLHQVGVFVLDQAELAGVVPARSTRPGARPEPWPFAVSAPDIRGRDLVSAADTLQKTTQGLALAHSEELLDREIAQQAVQVVLSQYGVEYDLPALRARLEQERQEREERAAPPLLPPELDLALPTAGG